MNTEGNMSDSIKPCSAVLDAGDSVTAVSISHVLTPDGRYWFFSVMLFCAIRIFSALVIFLWLKRP